MALKRHFSDKRPMMVQLRYLFFFAWLLTPLVALAQTDSASLLTPERFFYLVKRYHPVARQAGLLSAEAQAMLRVAKGNFDPKVFSDWERKSFDGKNYFTVGESGFKWPTFYGIEVKAGYNIATGLNINPEDGLPAAGQAVAGATFSLVQGLMIDERRATLAKARILQQANEAERLATLNDLLMDAAKTYWDWVLAYNQLRIFEESVVLAQVRFEGIRQAYLQGDRPAIDTLETYIQVQDRLFELNDARLEYVNTALALSNYLWTEKDVPAGLGAGAQAPLFDNLTVAPPVTEAAEAVRQLNDRHPLLQGYLYKLSQLDVDRRLKAEKLKPKLNVGYFFLGNGFDLLYSSKPGDQNLLPGLFTQNYKLGITFSTPVFFRSERGELELARLKISDTNFRLNQKKLELENKLLAYYNELRTNLQQVNLYTDVQRNYARLLDAENERFSIGESSVFLVNSRERKLIETRLKISKLQAGSHKLRASIDWAMGQLPASVQ